MSSLPPPPPPLPQVSVSSTESGSAVKPQEDVFAAFEDSEGTATPPTAPVQKVKEGGRMGVSE